jgi:hypothetical protein
MVWALAKGWVYPSDAHYDGADALLQMYLRSELGDGTIAVMKTLKDALDPHGIMNPGKVRVSPIAQVAELIRCLVAVPRLDYIDPPNT